MILLTKSGSIFVQIGDENVHRVRAVMDEVFGEDNSRSQITVKKKSRNHVPTGTQSNDYMLWYSQKDSELKFRSLSRGRDPRMTISSIHSFRPRAEHAGNASMSMRRDLKND